LPLELVYDLKAGISKARKRKQRERGERKKKKREKDFNAEGTENAEDAEKGKRGERTEREKGQKGFLTQQRTHRKAGSREADGGEMQDWPMERAREALYSARA